MSGHRRGSPGLGAIGPGLVAAASDNDPTTVGTVVAVGAATGYRLLWLVLVLLPMLAVVQVTATQVGSVTGRDLQRVAAERFGRRTAGVLMVSVVAVNVVTIAADLEAGAASVGILVGADRRWFVVPLAALTAGLLLLGTFDEVYGVLRYVLLGFAAYGVCALLSHPRWSAVARGSTIGGVPLDRTGVTALIALLGTTLTSYVYVWQTIEQAHARPRRRVHPHTATVGAVVGVALLVAIMWSIGVSAGATLAGHRVEVTTVQQAARSLRPLAGQAATTLFTLGLLASSLLALPVLMATTAYVVGAQFDWRRGLSEGIGRARRFYGVLVASVAAGVVTSLVGVPPVELLVVASVAGGLATPVGLAFLFRLATDPLVMGARPLPRQLARAGWAVTALVSVAAAAFVGRMLVGG